MLNLIVALVAVPAAVTDTCSDAAPVACTAPNCRPFAPLIGGKYCPQCDYSYGSCRFRGVGKGYCLEIRFWDCGKGPVLVWFTGPDGESTGQKAPSGAFCLPTLPTL
jgi:hypothetical protein